MALMVKVEKRGTGAKGQIKNGIKFATRKLRFALICSLFSNLIMGYLLYASTK